MKRSFPAALMIPFLGLSISAWGSQTTGLPVRPAAGQNQPAAPQSDSPGLSAPLTNADIAAMSKAKLPDSTILLTIDTALREGMAQFDTSPAALIELRQQGISEAVLNTMLLAGARLDEIARRPPDPMPALPQRYGVYYKSGQGFAPARSFLIWPPFFATGDLIAGFRDSRRGMMVDGSHAPLQTTYDLPAFYIRGDYRNRGWQILRVEVESDGRRIALERGDRYFSHIRFSPDILHNVNVTAVGDDVGVIRPSEPLPRGEYLLCGTIPGGRSALMCSDFGVR